MAYTIRYLKSAQRESRELRSTYGQGFSIAFGQWLEFLAQSAERKSTDASIDALKVLEDAAGADGSPTQWMHAWDRFLKAGGLKKVQALLVVLRKRCPPWQFRMAANWFSLLDVIPAEIHTYYAIDHCKRDNFSHV